MPRTDMKSAPRPRDARAPDGTETTLPSTVSLLARAPAQSSVLPYLHQHAVARSGGTCSVLFRHNPRTGALHATSGYGLEALRTDPWVSEPAEAALVTTAFESAAPL